ncbi:MAG: hypothetical protein ACRCSP_04560 [Rhodoglobus sp.]
MSIAPHSDALLVEDLEKKYWGSVIGLTLSLYVLAVLAFFAITCLAELPLLSSVLILEKFLEVGVFQYLAVLATIIIGLQVAVRGAVDDRPDQLAQLIVRQRGLAHLLTFVAMLTSFVGVAALLTPNSMGHLDRLGAAFLSLLLTAICSEAFQLPSTNADRLWREYRAMKSLTALESSIDRWRRGAAPLSRSGIMVQLLMAFVVIPLAISAVVHDLNALVSTKAYSSHMDAGDIVVFCFFYYFVLIFTVMTIAFARDQAASGHTRMAVVQGTTAVMFGVALLAVTIWLPFLRPLVIQDISLYVVVIGMIWVPLFAGVLLSLRLGNTRYGGAALELTLRYLELLEHRLSSTPPLHGSEFSNGGASSDSLTSHKCAVLRLAFRNICRGGAGSKDLS